MARISQTRIYENGTRLAMVTRDWKQADGWYLTQAWMGLTPADPRWTEYPAGAKFHLFLNNRTKPQVYDSFEAADNAGQQYVKAETNARRPSRATNKR